MIYEDANKLEEVLAERMREMGLGTIESVVATSSVATPTVVTATTTPSDITSVRRTVERRV
jgi:hypothetical protein